MKSRMRKWWSRFKLLCVFLVCGRVVLALASCVALPPKNVQDLCDIFAEKRSWYKAARQSERKWGIPMHVSMSILYQESSFKARAKPPRKYWLGFVPGPRPSSAYGYAQALDSTWQNYRVSSGHFNADRDDFGDAIDFVAWYSRQSVKKNGIGANDAHGLYLAYHEGHGGYSRKSYAKKSWLLRVADRVKRRAQTYQKQYAACQKELDKPWWLRWFAQESSPQALRRG